MLEVLEASGGYSGTPILRSVTLRVGHGETVALLGRNGSGKTTALKYVMGLLDSTGGTVTLDRQPIPHVPERRAHAGLGYVPQGRFVFPRLTSAENIAAAAIAHGRAPSQALDESFELFPALKRHAGSLAGQLSGGQQQMLAIARAMATQPRVLVLDEPTEGVQPSIVDELIEALRRLSASGLAVLLAEQDLDVALELASRAYVMDRGAVEREAAGAELRRDRQALHDLLGV